MKGPKIWFVIMRVRYTRKFVIPGSSLYRDSIVFSGVRYIGIPLRGVYFRGELVMQHLAAMWATALENIPRYFISTDLYTSLSKVFESFERSVEILGLVLIKVIENAMTSLVFLIDSTN